jgi:serine/threonine-protein kinase HipA
LLGLTDGDNATNGHGYLDIVDFIVQHCCDVEANLQELFRRVAFNICIGNTDDHFRNHGFLLTARGWTLSPAYDMNPTLNNHQSLMITSTTNSSDLGLLLDACEEYMLTRTTAERIINEVKTAMATWRSHATKLDIAQREIDYFSSKLDCFNII